MKMLVKPLTYLTLFGAVLGFSAQLSAIEIDSMLKFADKRGKQTFTLTNDADKRMYVRVNVAELTVVNGEIEKVPYTRHNLNAWALDVSPVKTIVEPGFEKQFVAQIRCEEECTGQQDRIFQLGFSPTPYVEHEEQGKSAVQLTLGIASVLIQPGVPRPLEYDLSYTGKSVTFHNRGGSYFQATVDTCPVDATRSERYACTKEFTVLAGRKLSVDLPESMRAPTLTVTMKTHAQTYTQTETLTRQ